MNKILNKTFKYTCLAGTAFLALASCSKFDEVNLDPTAAQEGQVQVEYLINNAIIGAQMNPDIAERSFVLYWEPAGRQVSDFDGGAINVANYDDGWTTNYFNGMASWLTRINKAVQIAEKRLSDGSAVKDTRNNLLQVARIWRAYLMSEAADNWGSIPVTAFESSNPDYADLKDVYYFMLAELKDATAKMDVNLKAPEAEAKEDPAYKFDFAKWKKYGNSMRLRLAMRLSEVDPAKAKAEFEDAAASLDDLIVDNAENFAVQEVDGWSDLSGVMSRSWDIQPMSVTYRNLVMGLGGIKSEDQLAGKSINGGSIADFIKDADDLGLRYFDYFPLKNNDPLRGYWLNGLPQSVDPRAYVVYSIPGDTLSSGYPAQNGAFDKVPVRNLYKVVADTLQVVEKVNARFTFNARIDGAWSTKDQLNELVNYGGTMPRLNMRFRNSTEKRVFFGAWETYFLLAEATVRHWNVPIAGKEAYENGVKASFDFWNIGQYADAYLASTDYNNNGTSVSWTHVAEPPATRTMKYTDGITKVKGTVQIEYPENTLYKEGKKNDLLTKVITQKFLAQVPWVPLENWSDHRRLGLPFFENPTVEKPITTLPGLNEGTAATPSIKFLPQRLKYPSNLKNQNPKGYGQATGFLGGADEVLTPLWWAQQQ